MVIVDFTSMSVKTAFQKFIAPILSCKSDCRITNDRLSVQLSTKPRTLNLGHIKLNSSSDNKMLHVFCSDSCVMVWVMV